MPQEVDTRSQSISETLFCLLVHFFFGALLFIASYLGYAIAVILLFDQPNGISRAWVPIILLVNLVIISVACLFGAWQWQRIPKKWWMVACDTILAGLIIVGMQWCVNGRLL